jgi:ribosomal protein S13
MVVGPNLNKEIVMHVKITPEDIIDDLSIKELNLLRTLIDLKLERDTPPTEAEALCCVALAEQWVRTSPPNVFIGKYISDNLQKIFGISAVRASNIHNHCFETNTHWPVEAV